MLKQSSTLMVVGALTLAAVLLPTQGLIAARQTAVPQLEHALTLDVEVLRVRRCYNDVSTSADHVDVRLIFANVSTRPIAVVQNQRGVVYRVHLDPGRSAEQGEPPSNVVVHFDPLFGNNGPLLGDRGRPELDGFAVLFPKDALALGTTLSLTVARPGVGRGVVVLRGLPYTASVTSALGVAEFEAEDQPVSTARWPRVESRQFALDLSAPLPLEFCEVADGGAR